MDASVITPDATHRQVPLREGLAQWLDRLAPLSRDLGCEDELAFAATLGDKGASYQRQRATGGPEQALRLLLAETGKDSPFAG